MNWNPHYNLKDKHAFLGASQNTWLRYDKEKLMAVFEAMKAKERGTALHDLAQRMINLKVKAPRNRKTFNAYVNDCIGFDMKTEQPLQYSDYCFGTADAISFEDNTLRIFDLKTGTAPAKIDQLLVYASLFCLEYGYKPADIKIELSIYQNDEIITHKPKVDEIVPIMDKIIQFSKILETNERG